MCRQIWYRHRCGHESRGPKEHCQKYLEGGAFACGEQDFTPVRISNPCSEKGCNYAKFGGKWKCCHCGMPNTGAVCNHQMRRDRGIPHDCAHYFCDDCMEFVPFKTAVSSALSSAGSSFRSTFRPGSSSGDKDSKKDKKSDRSKTK